MAAPGAEPSNYIERYITNGDVLNGNYALINREYSASNTSRTADQLREMVVSADLSVPPVFLALVRDGNGNPIVMDIHRPTKYIPNVAWPALHWEGKSFCFLGDIQQDTNNFVWTVGFPDNAFEATGQHRVYTTAHTETALATLPVNQVQFDPIPAADANSQLLTVRRLALVLHRYLPVPLGQTWTPRQAWNHFVPQIRNDSNENNCSSLLDWLRMAVTKATNPTPRGNPLQPPSSLGTIGVDSFLPLVADPNLARHRWTTLFWDIPSLNGRSMGSTTQMAVLLLSTFELARAAEQAANPAQKAAERADKLPPQSRNRSIAHTRMNFGGVANEIDLPEVYHYFHALTTASSDEAAALLPRFAETTSISTTTTEWNKLTAIPDVYAIHGAPSTASVPSTAPLTAPPSTAAKPNETLNVTSNTTSRSISCASNNPRNGALVLNPQVNQAWKAALEKSTKRIRDVHIHAPHSNSDVDRDNKPIPMCLSYHVMGQCYSNCTRTKTHRVPTDVEEASLQFFVSTHLSE